MCSEIIHVPRFSNVNNRMPSLYINFSTCWHWIRQQCHQYNINRECLWPSMTGHVLSARYYCYYYGRFGISGCTIRSQFIIVGLIRCKLLRFYTYAVYLLIISNFRTLAGSKYMARGEQRVKRYITRKLNCPFD